MDELEKRFTLLLDLTREVNIVNITFIVSIILSRLFPNVYFALALVFLICIVLQMYSKKLFIKKFGNLYLVSKTKAFFIAVVVLNLLIISYLFLIGEYIAVIILLSFYILSYLFMKKLRKQNHPIKAKSLKAGLYY